MIFTNNYDEVEQHHQINNIRTLLLDFLRLTLEFNDKTN